MNIISGHEDRKLEDLPRYERREQFYRHLSGPPLAGSPSVSAP